MSDDGRRRIREMFETAASADRAVLLPYLTAGLPTVETSIELFVAMAEAGADGFEVGIPYADPLMDGPVIMDAGEKALASGVTVSVALEVVRRIVEATDKPVLVMTYVNPVLRHGVHTFFQKVAAAGASGVIVADLPVDEAAPFLDAADETGLGMVLFVAPTTDDRRLALIASADPVFIYGIAEVGVTGERSRGSTNLEALSQRVRRVSDVPLVFGVGISSPAHAAAAAASGDGVIVGSAIVRRVLEAPDGDAARSELVAVVEELGVAVRRS
jgi:tryptophan synthase alpha chain